MRKIEIKKSNKFEMKWVFQNFDKNHSIKERRKDSYY